MKKFIKQLFPNLSEDGDLRFLYKNSRYKLFYEITFFIVSFFITWCFGNLTSPEFYGTYLFITNIVIFFSFLSFAGIEQSLTQSVANGYDYFFITAIKKKLIYSFFGGVIIFIFAVLYALLVEFNYVILVSLIISGLFFPFTSVFNLYHFFLDGKGDFKRDLIFRLITYIVTSILLLILIFISRNLILHFILLRGALFCFNIYFMRYCLKRIEVLEQDELLDKKAIKYGLSLTSYSFITLVSLNINNIIIGSYFGPSMLAFYSIGKGLANKANTLIKPSFSVLLTKYSKEEAKISKKFIGFLILGSILLFFILIIALPFYLQFFFPEYIGSLNYGIAYSFIPLLMPIVVVLGYYFRGKANNKVIRNAQIIPDIISLTLIYPLLLLFGIYGLILSEFLRYLGRIIIYIFYKKSIELE